MSDCKDCLRGLLGLTDIDCECYEDDRPTDYNESESGYFITDSEYGIPFNQAIFAAKDCMADGSNIWQVLEKSRTEAIRDLCNDLQKGIYTLNERYKVFSEQIGQLKGSMTSSGGTWVGQIWKPKKSIKGGKLCVSSISLGLTQSAAVEVFIFNKSNLTTPINSVIVNTIAGEWVTVPFELDLDVSTNDCVNEYYFAYELPAGASYFQNKFKCCGNRPEWQKQIQAHGFYGADLNNIKTNSTYASGLSVHTSFACDGLDWICSLDKIKGFDFKALLGVTLLFKTVSKVLTRIEQQGQINFFTVLDAERLSRKRSSAVKNYKNNISYIVENIPSNLSDCFRCEGKISKMAIKV